MNLQIKKKKVSILRFPEFEGEWKETAIRNLADISSGGTPSRNRKEYWNGNIPWITTSLIDFNTIDDAKEYITKDGLANSSAKIFPKGTMLIGLYGQGVTRGKVAILALEAATNQACAAFFWKKEVGTTFMFYQFQRNYDRIRNISNLGGQKNLSGTLLKSIKVAFPSLSEQQKIADFLTAIDIRIQHLTSKVDLLEAYKKGVMQQIFSQAIRFKDDQGKDYPDWEEKPLGEVGSTYNGLTGKTKEDFGRGKPYINYKQIFDNSKIDIKKFDFVEINPGERQSRVKYGDIFFTTSSETPNEVGFASVLLDQLEELYLNSFCFGYRLKSFRILRPEFAQFLFRSEGFRKKVYRLAQGSTRYNLSKREMMKLEVSLPIESEQQKIADFLGAIDQKIELTRQQRDQMQEYKKGLLQQMFV